MQSHKLPSTAEGTSAGSWTVAPLEDIIWMTCSNGLAISGTRVSRPGRRQGSVSTQFFVVDMAYQPCVPPKNAAVRETTHLSGNTDSQACKGGVFAAVDVLPDEKSLANASDQDSTFQLTLTPRGILSTSRAATRHVLGQPDLLACRRDLVPLNLLFRSSSSRPFMTSMRIARLSTSFAIGPGVSK
jgi:hypothetical protein